MKTPTLAFIALFPLALAFSGLTLSWSAQEGSGRPDDKSTQVVDNAVARAPGTSGAQGEAGRDKTFSELDRLDHEWRLARIHIRFKESILVCVLAVASLAIVLFFMMRKDSKSSGGDIIHVSGLVFIIFGTIFLVVIADVDEQLTASIGVLGAIAGYLFGRRAAGDSSGETPPAGGTQ